MVKEIVTWTITKTQIDINKILRLFFPEKFISGVISGVPLPPPLRSSHSLDSILKGDKPPCGPPESPPGLPMEKNKKTLRKLLITLINKPIK